MTDTDIVTDEQEASPLESKQAITKKLADLLPELKELLEAWVDFRKDVNNGGFKWTGDEEEAS